MPEPLEKRAPTSLPIHDILSRRWSSRAYNATRPVPREQLTLLLEAARWAPSCNGDEPWRYLIWDRSRDPAGWQKAYDCLWETNRKWVQYVPVLLLSCAGSHFAATGKPNRWTQHDTGAASCSLALQGAAIGIMVHQMGGFDVEKARAAFAIPADYTPMAMIAIGYQSSPDILDPETKEKELRPRSRRALAGSFFEGGWGQGYAEG
ncbi:MAG: nitroreductase family protein [Burkholderiales bacterium]|nr:nitroreductase family protein [Burkholderiales bacterium]